MKIENRVYNNRDIISSKIGLRTCTKVYKIFLVYSAPILIAYVRKPFSSNFKILLAIYTHFNNDQNVKTSTICSKIIIHFYHCYNYTEIVVTMLCEYLIINFYDNGRTRRQRTLFNSRIALSIYNYNYS